MARSRAIRHCNIARGLGGLRIGVGLNRMRLMPGLALGYALLIVYASLYPLSGWRDSGVPLFDFLSGGWPRYFTGFDLFINVPIPFTVSLLGGTIKVPGINESIDLKIPELTQTGATFTLKGKGIKKLRKVGNGDIIVTVTVEMPKNLDNKTKELIKDVNERLTDNNYSKYKDYLSKL